MKEKVYEEDWMNRIYGLGPDKMYKVSGICETSLFGCDLFVQRIKTGFSPPIGIRSEKIPRNILIEYNNRLYEMFQSSDPASRRLAWELYLNFVEEEHGH